MFCPECGSKKIEPTVFGIPLPLGLVELATDVFGDPIEWKCRACGFKWTEKKGNQPK
jgi:predicted Zn-ribbon and HTH transcriptional regulator